MKFLVILAVAVACAAADVSHIVGPDAILKSSFESHPEGHFSYDFETSNGIITHSDGVVKNPNTENAALEIKGFVKYTSPDGTPVNLEYVSNEFGYQAVGSHVPVAPPVPEYILRSIQYIAEHPAPERVIKKP
ncbi:larval cuticle protein LCP-17-like [Melitaea cinxia]|uniref:larval cuticle protein LCP-17-like n=1 Tax=Melitaea cinxia TaxID=113334 RepID=UPI001E270D19|nr:larval cuticle protein LCP-17-like [Melitaea cinxia]